MGRDTTTINARKIFPNLKSDAEVTDKHRELARRALAEQIMRKRRPSFPRTKLWYAMREGLLSSHRGRT